MVDLDKLSIVEFIGKRYGTFNPFVIADKLNIAIEWCDLGNNLMGKVAYIGGHPIVLLNESFEDRSSQYFYCAHELAHVIWQEGLTGAYNLNSQFKSKFEYQATQYAILILINLYREDYDRLPSTYRELETEYGIPEQ